MEMNSHCTYIIPIRLLLQNIRANGSSPDPARAALSTTTYSNREFAVCPVVKRNKACSLSTKRHPIWFGAPSPPQRSPRPCSAVRLLRGARLCFKDDHGRPHAASHPMPAWTKDYRQGRASFALSDSCGSHLLPYISPLGCESRCIASLFIML